MQGRLFTCAVLGSLLGLVSALRVGAEPLLEGRVRLASGEPVAEAQVRFFDRTDLGRGAIARVMTDGTGYFALPLAALGGHALPQGFGLGPNYPNPFNPSTIIPYQLAASSAVRLEVFNLLGQHIATLVDGERSAGFHTATWHATDGAGRAVGAGVYIYRMTVGVERQTGRMVLVDGQAGIPAGGAAFVLPGASGGGLGVAGEQEYKLTVSGRGLVPYVDGSFRVAEGMAPVELVVSAGKVTADEPVSIPDAKLRAAIAALLGKASGTTITKAEMESLGRTKPRFLRARNAGISDLTGLEFATNLTKLDLSNNNIISDLSPLAGLTNLKELSLSGNNISDLSPLAGLTNLTSLHLNNNNISDISPLKGLTSLKSRLDLSNNNISDISPLRDLPNLTWVLLDGNPLSAASINDHIPVLQARGVEVWFGSTPSSDDPPVTDDSTPAVAVVTDDPTPVTIPDANLRAAIAAALGITPPGDLTTLMGTTTSPTTITRGDMTTLSRLGATDAGIRDLTGLEFATNLRGLDLQVNDISDVSPLSGLTNLTFLGFRVNDISDVSSLSGLTNLTFLSLSGNQVTDISSLSGLTNLRILDLQVNDISDVSILRGLTNLTFLSLSGNQVTDISSLSGLTNLTFLGLSGNDISDVSPLSGLTNLTELALASNQVTDISPLSGLTNLRILDLRVNSLNVSSINDHIPALERHSVTVLFDQLREGDFDIELVFLDSFSERHKRHLQYAARRWMSIIREDLPDYTFTQGWSGQCGDHSYQIPAGERIDDLRIYITGLDDSPVAWGGPQMLRGTSGLPIVGCMGFNIVGQGDVDISLHEMGHVLGIGTLWDVQDSNGDLYFNGPLAIAAFNDAGGWDYPGKKVPLTRHDWGGHWRGPVLAGALMSNVGGLNVLSAITIQALADLGWVVDVTQADPYTLPRARAAKVAALPGDRLLGRLAPHPPLSCGVGQERQPIHVVDEQGRIIRTLPR